MNVVFAVSEAVPFCKTGGLADVAGALPKALVERGAEVSVFVPYYREVREKGLSLERVSGAIRVSAGGESVEARLHKTRIDGVTAYLVDCPRFYDRASLYGERGTAYEDNAARFAFFSRAVLEGSKLAGIRPAVFHCHDWQTGLVPVYLRTLYARDPDLGAAAALFTIHNLAYQGIFDKGFLGLTGLPPSVFTMEGIEYYDSISFLKGGLVFSDFINTVSPAYAREIQTAAYGLGLEGLLRSRRSELWGILNGLDLGKWDPRRDAALARRYGREDFRSGKAACKAALQKECGLPARSSALLIGTISRFDHHKGLDLALEALPDFLGRGAQYVALGSGDPALEESFRVFCARHPGRARYREGYDDPLARRIYSAADLFLMPSRFEPCGLGQMISMRYGTLPLGVRTGGLGDTVPPHGFLAESPDSESLWHALDEAERLFGDKDRWNSRAAAAMSADFAWDSSAGSYLELYAKAAARRNGSSA